MRTTVIMGLGNPGPAYAGTRHNVGFRCADDFALRHGVRFARNACGAQLAELELADAHVVIAKPRTFMNLSGRSALALTHALGISPENLVVVYDDVDLPLGRLRVRPSGGSGGHNGVRSILEALDTDKFPRVRVGIGRPDEPGSTGWSEASLIDYVLTSFTAEQETIIEEAISRVSDILDCIVEEGIDAAMSRFNSVVWAP